MKTNPFLGKSLCVINDLSLDEIMYLFQKTKELKEVMSNVKNKKRTKFDLKPFMIDDPSFGVYEVFLEPSTRTAQSFLNASQFHDVKLNTLQADHSSFTKNESYGDAFNNLTGYENSIFIVRSKLEGLCRWLEVNGSNYAERNGLIVPPAFINAGDGKHEHPTQELLDEFTFLEDSDWNNDHIHVALIGDILHGRTVHSKVDGLKIFKNVEVDLVSPELLNMPQNYIKRMKENGFNINSFDSLDEYISSKRLASKWYFTRPQLERMGDDILQKADELRSKITFKKKYLDKIPEGTIFYHPLPRHKAHPTIPLFLDNTPLNGWENQSANGRYIRINLLGLIAGKIGNDFEGEASKKKIFVDDFINEIDPVAKIKENYKGIKPIENGVCIDHICKGKSTEEIWKYLSKVMSIMEFNSSGYIGVDQSKQDSKYKGMIFLPNHIELSPKEIKKLATISSSTYNLITNGKIIRKMRLNMPPRIYGFDEISCKNHACISHPSNHEGCITEFHRKDDVFVCKYCETQHTPNEIWK